MEKHYGSCGHLVTLNDMKKSPSVMMDFTTRGERTVSVSTLCKYCRKLYLNRGVILANEDMKTLWLNGEIAYPE